MFHKSFISGGEQSISIADIHMMTNIQGKVEFYSGHNNIREVIWNFFLEIFIQNSKNNIFPS